MSPTELSQRYINAPHRTAPPWSDPRIVRNYRAAAQVIGWASIATGLVVLLLGWWLGLETVRMPITETVAMKANAALGFTLVGLSLVAYLRGWAKGVALAPAGIVTFLAGVNLAEYAVGAPATWLDDILAKDPASLLSGRLVAATAVWFAATGIALLLLALGRWPGLRQAIGAAVTLIAVVGIFGYLYDESVLGDWSKGLVPVAPHTVILELSLGAALVIADPGVGWARTIASPSVGGRFFRIAFLPVVLVVVMMGAAADYFAFHAFGGMTELGLVLAQLVYPTAGVILVALLLWVSVRADRVDRQRLALDAQRVEDQKNLADSEQRFRWLAENASDIVWQVNLNGELMWVAPSVEAELGWRAEQLLGTNVLDLIHPDDRDSAAAWKKLLLEGIDVPTLESRRLAADGSYRWMSVRGRVVFGPDGASAVLILGLVEGLRDIHEEVSARTRLAYAIGHDPLTGLSNFSATLARIDELLADLSSQPSGRKVGVLSVGVDALKKVNDAFTHAGGDRVLLEIASRIATVECDASLLGRGSGDEFLVLIPSLDEPVDAGSVAERVCEAVRGTILIEQHRFEPTVSIGIATGSGDADPEELVREAALAMRNAKDSGRDRVEFFESQLAILAKDRFLVEADLRDGVRQGQLVPWFQPIVNLADGVVVGYEALVRWVRPDGTVVPPEDFLPVAEQTNLIVDLDLAVLKQCVEALACLPESVFVAVNVSPITLAAADYARSAKEALTRSGVDVTRLHIEFTETVLLNVSEHILDSMKGLADLGVRWYVDDFGTGFSSISHLRDLPVAGLKLDLSFTAGLGSDDPTCEQLAKALVGMADGLGLDTVAEGVETPEQAAILRAQGWQHAQGWLYGRPVAMDWSGAD